MTTEISWNDIRTRALAFSKDWEGSGYEKGETHSFYNDFFEVFGLRRRDVAVFESQVKKLNNRKGFIDLFWPGFLLVEQKSAGHDLKKAREQADEYFLGLKPAVRPRHMLLSDFETFILYDLDEDSESHFTLADLHEHVEEFWFIAGREGPEFDEQDLEPVNVKASKLMGKVYDALEEAGYKGHDLGRFLVRLVFCLFADNTRIFHRKYLFRRYLKERTLEDGSDLGSKLSELFQVLDTDVPDRLTTLDEDLKAFPYINGDLFQERLDIPSFTAPMRNTLIEAAKFDWSEVSPAIFGALFQSVMDKEERRHLGAYYTTEKNILKVIEPLFMDELWKEFEKIKKLKGTRKKALQDFQEKRLGNLTFFDPACGCGNFLVIAYRELRRLEIEVLQEIFPPGRPVLDITALSKIDVNQFYGIEISEFPGRIAETALWMMDHIMNNELGRTFGKNFARIPLKESPHILCADALETDWNNLLPAKECDYILGNPPFGGAKLQSREQRAQVRRIANLGGSGGSLDYVTAWFLKAGEYVRKGRGIIGFVATNSITQGEQVGQIWPLLFDRFKLEITFAHRTFAWGPAEGKAQVHVVIIGLTRADMEPKQKRLFSYPDINDEPEKSRHVALSPYLFDSAKLANRHLVVEEESRAINGLPKLIMGSKPIDGGHYIFTEEEKFAFLAKEPGAKEFLRPFIGAKEYLQGGVRWILSLQNASPKELQSLPEVKKRIAAVRKYREASKSGPTQKIADTPTLYHINVIPDKPFLVIPRVSSERREYAAIGWMEPPVIPSDSTTVLLNADLSSFAFLTSAMHMAWLRYIGGRLESRYRYSIGVVYNTFPMPEMTGCQKAEIGKKAQAVLDVRAAHPGETLANLYDPNSMPPNLHKAHTALDRAVDRLYRKAPFNSERERVEHLFALYEKMTAPLTAKPKRRKRRT